MNQTIKMGLIAGALVSALGVGAHAQSRSLREAMPARATRAAAVGASDVTAVVVLPFVFEAWKVLRGPDPSVAAPVVGDDSLFDR